MTYRIDKQGLLDSLSVWNGFLKKKVHLIACGGTALTLLEIKPSTKDIDLLVPVIDEYEYLIRTLKQLGYKNVSGHGWARDGGFIFDLFRGKFVHTTELLESPLDGKNHITVKEYERIYLGILNYYDLLISKLFRGTDVDIDDCRMLIKAKKAEVDMDMFTKRFRETAACDTSEERVIGNLTHFLSVVKKEGLHGV